MTSWDPNKSQRLDDALELLIELIHTGRIDPNNFRPADLINQGGELALLANSAFKKKFRPGWAQELWPATEEDQSGFSSFVPFIRDLSGIEITNARRDHGDINRFDQSTHNALHEVSYAYKTGEISREEALQLTEGITLTDTQMRTYFPSQERKQVESKEYSPLERNLRRLQRAVTKPRSNIHSVARKNPKFLAGEVYQQLAGTFIRLSHLDDRVYEEVALTVERDEEGKITSTRDIADFVVLEGYSPNKKRRLSEEERKVHIYEIKLGRQREGLVRQLQNQRKAAEALGLENVVHHLAMGGDSRVAGAELSQFKRMIGALGVKIGGESALEGAEQTSIDWEVESRQMYEYLSGTKNLDEILKEVPGIILESTSGLAEQAFDRILGKTARMRSKVGELMAAHEVREEYIEFMKNIDNYLLVQELISTIYADTIERKADSEVLDWYEKNLYLLNHFIDTVAKKELKDSRLRRTQIELSSLKSMRKIAEYISSQQGLVNERNLTPFNVEFWKRANNLGKIQAAVYNATIGKLQGKQKKALTPEELEDILSYKSIEQFWSEYFPNVKELLNDRNKTRVRILGDNLFSEPETAFRAFRVKNHKYSWLEKELLKVGETTEEIDWTDDAQVQEAVDTLRTHIRNNAEYRTKTRLETIAEDLEDCLNPEAYSRRSGTGLTSTEKLIQDLGYETSKGIKGLIYQDRRDSYIRLFGRIIDFAKRAVGKKSQVHIYGQRINERSLSSRARKEFEGQFKASKKKDLKAHVRKMKVLTGKEALFHASLRAQDGLYGLVKEFENSSNLNDLDKQITNYLLNLPQRIVDRTDIVGPVDMEFRALESRAYRNRIVEEQGIMDRYLGGQMLRAVTTARAISVYDAEKGQEYFSAARKEVLQGGDYGSKAIAREVLDTVKATLSDEVLIREASQGAKIDQVGEAA